MSQPRRPQGTTGRAACFPFLAASAAVMLALAVAFRAFTADDAFITFRYAANLAAGLGPTWDPDLPRAEGYTGLLWMLWMVLPHALGWDALLFAKVTGTLCTLSTLACTAVLARVWLGPQARPAHFAAGAASLLLATNPDAAVHAVSGMETAAFTLALTAFLLSLVAAAEDPCPRSLLGVSILGLIVGLLRPDGNIAVLIGFAGLLLMLPGTLRLGFLKYAAVAYILPGAIYFIWRFHYYGLLFPLAFYVKTGHGVGPGLEVLLQFARTYGARPIGLLALLGLSQARRATWPALAAAAVFMAFFVIPAPVMGYSFRFLYPVVPFICAIAAGGLHLCAQALRRSAFASPSARAGVLAAVLCAACGVQLARVPSLLAARSQYAKGLQACHITLGRQLAAYHGPQARPTLAVGDAGAIPYYSNWRAIDSFGLNDPWTAVRREYSPAHVLSMKPDLIIVISTSQHRFQTRVAYEAGLYQHALAAGFAVLSRRRFADDYYLWLLAVPNSPVGAYISALDRGSHRGALDIQQIQRPVHVTAGELLLRAELQQIPGALGRAAHRTGV